MGPALGRALFVMACTLPFILAGLLSFGLLAAYTLRRLSIESVLTYALVGTASGALLVAVIFPVGTSQLLIGAGYGAVCAVLWWSLRSRV